MAFRLIFTTILLLLLSAEASHAEPISAIVTAIGMVLKAGGIAAALLKGAFAVAISVGTGLIQQARAKKAQRKQEPRGTTLSVQFGDTQPLSYIIGTRATAGRRYYAGTWGSADNTPNAFATDCRVISSLPSYAGPQGLDEVWFGETEGTILWDQPHPDGRGYPVQAFRGQSGTDYLWVKYLDGSQTTADAFLLEKFGAVEDHPYLPTMIGRGCQLVIFTCRVTEVFFPNGFPDGLFVPKPMKLYDLRFDSTEGGSGTQRWEDHSTWESSDLLPVMMYNLARGIYYDGKWVHGGRNFAAHKLPASSWMAAINEADRAMEGGRKQFRGGLEVFVDDEPLDTLEDMRVGCAGRLVEVGGALKLQVGSPAGAVYSFTDANVVVTSDQDFEPFPSITATHNTITADYPEPKERWAYKDAPQKTSAALISRDGGQVLPVPVRFEAVPFSAQVQSLMTAMIAEEQRWRIHNLHLPPDAIALEPNDVLSWSSEKQFYSTKRFIAVRVTRLTGGLVRVLMKEIDPNDYDPPEIILPPVIGWLGPIISPPHPMFGWDVQPAALPDATGAPRRPSMEVSCAADQDGIRNVWIQVRLKATGVVVYDMDAIAYAAPYAWIINATFLPATMYEARGRYVPYRAKDIAEWSGWKDVLTPNILLGDADIYLPGMVEELQEFVGEATEWIRDGTRQLMLEQQRLARLNLDEDVGAFTERQQLRRELVATADGLTASYTEAIDAAAGPNSALARRTESLEAVIPKLATATAFNALLTRVSSAEGVITAQSLAITEIQAELPNKASASAFNSLSATVTDLSGTVTSQADAITAISAGSTSGNTATANFRMGVSAGPAGYSSRIAMEARTGGAGTWRPAGLFIDVPASASSPSRIVLLADQIAFSNGATVKKPFIYEGSVLYLDEARIKMAHIDELLVGTSNIAPGAVTVADSATLAGGAMSSGNRDVTLTINHGTGSPEVIILGSAVWRTSFTDYRSWSLQARAGSTALNALGYFSEVGFDTGGTIIARHVPASGTSSTTYTVRMSTSGAGNAGLMTIVVYVGKR